MRQTLAFIKKELTEAIRGGRLIFLGILFLALGIMNPAIAKLTPFLLEMMSDTLAESGMTIAEVAVDALTSWTQFFKNIPIGLIAFLLIYSGILTREYESGALVLMLTKGVSRRSVVLAKTLTLLGLWSAGYWLCFAVTYGYNAYFWDNSAASSLGWAVGAWYLFGVWTVCLCVLFSAVCKRHTHVLLGVGGCVLLSYVIGLFPKLSSYTPTYLLGSAPLLTGAESPETYAWSLAVTAALSLVSLALSFPIMDKRQL